MGLDMYLERVNINARQYIGTDLEELKTEKPNEYEKIKPYIKVRGGNIQWEDVCENVGYWRKANAIHNYFVENVQDGIDDCGYYFVSRIELEELLLRCETIINTYHREEENEFETIASELLPTTIGFFFGTQDYDEYYMEDITKTISIVKSVLKTTDFNTECIVYSSSW